MDASDTLRRAREAAGLSQRELADRTLVPQPRIAEYERGRAIPRVDRLSLLLAACSQRLQAVDAERHADEGAVTAEDLQLLTLHRAMTPAQRLATFMRLDRLRGAGLRRG